MDFCFFFFFWHYFRLAEKPQKYSRGFPSALHSASPDRNTYCRSLIIFLSPLNYLRGGCRHETPFISKYFSVYFLRTWTFSLKEGGIFFHDPGVIIWIREMNMDALCNLICRPYSDFACCPGVSVTTKEDLRSWITFSFLILLVSLNLDKFFTLCSSFIKLTF